MAIPRAKSPETLYDEVKDYDLVLVPNSPLARAIKRRTHVPRFGTFTTAPRPLAAGRTESAEERAAFLDVVRETDNGWKATARSVQNVLGCWEHEGTADSVLGYDAYTDETTEDVVGAVPDVRTTTGQLSDYRIDDEQDVAVIGLDQFTRIERSILPEEYDSYDLFSDEEFEMPPFHIFDSPAEIVDALLDTVTEENAENVAVVLDSGSEYSSLVESAFETAGIPFYGGPKFIDEPNHRAFLSLLRAGFRGSNTTVRDLRPLLSQLDVDLGTEHDEKRLDVVDVPELEWIEEVRAGMTEKTFGGILDEYESRANVSLVPFRDELTRLGISDERVTSDRIDDLAFYLERYEVPVDRENEGVLLADANSSGYVDRPVVFYLGLDDGWTDSAPQRPWIDTEEQFRRNISQFQLLLQSGEEQYYLVQDTSGGQPVTPCLYFSELLDEEFERFSDLPSVEHTRSLNDGSDGFERSEEVSVEPETVDTVSQSSLNSYVNSPRDYLFGRLVDSPDKDYFEEGTLFHDFAEFYVNHPDRVDEDVIDEAVEVMLEEVRPYYPSTDETLRRRKYRVGLETIVRFLDENPPEEPDFLTQPSGSDGNYFAEYYGVELDSPLTELDFEDDALGVDGKIDLIHAPEKLLDYKTGSKKSRRDVVKRSAIDPTADTPNYQAVLYLCYYRSLHPDEPLEFSFFHFLEPMEDVIEGNEPDLDDALTTVRYYPCTFDEFVGSRDAYDTVLDHYSDCAETFEDLGFTEYTEVMGQLSFPDISDREELRESKFAEVFASMVSERTEGVDAEKGCDQAVRKFHSLRGRTFFREDLDAFEGFLQDRIEELNRRRAGEDRFPVNGLDGNEDPNYRRIDHRDMLLEGER